MHIISVKTLLFFAKTKIYSTKTKNRPVSIVMPITKANFFLQSEKKFTQSWIVWMEKKKLGMLPYLR